jgi:hypothetical protein
MDQLDKSLPLSLTERFAALNRVGTALMSELNETRLITWSPFPIGRIRSR